MDTSIEPTNDTRLVTDDLSAFMDEQVATNTAYREALEDVRELHAILDRLIALRSELGISQREVARRMGVRQPTVSQFENESSDPRISTLQRYARALNARVRVDLVHPSSGSWHVSVPTQYVHTETACLVEPVSHRDNVRYIDRSLADQWTAADSNRSDFVLSA
ncbi:MAG: helix-turn-helix domain-containing protein [Jatrophihabitantaceae bacterium]